MDNLKTKKLDTFQDFMNLEEELQQLLLKYPNMDKIDVVYKPNSLNDSQLNHIDLAFSNSQCDIIRNDEEFRTYYRLQFDRLGICTWNEITEEMSQADKDEERGIEMLEDQRQSD